VSPRPSRRRSVLLGVALALAVPLAGAGVAQGAAPSRSVLTVGAGAPGALRAPGLRVLPLGGATGTGRRVVVPVASAGGGARPAVVHAPAAGLRVLLAGRAVRVLDLRMAARGTTLTARVGSRRVGLLALAGVRTSSSATGARTLSARVSVTPAGARALRTALRAPRLRAGRLGTLTTSLAAPAAVPGPPAGPGPAAVPGPPAVPAVPAAPGTPAAPAAPAPAAPATPAPADPLPADPVSTTPGLEWTIRGSWLSYLSGGGGRVESTGAERLASGAYAFPAATGGVDAEGRGAFATTGAVRFRQENHGIDMEFADFAFALGAGSPTVTAVYTDRNSLGGVVGDGVPRRIDFGTLDLKDVAPEREGDLLVLRRVPVHLSAEAAEPFLYYQPGEAFGSMTLRIPVTG
jgi:hypothetical protein